MGAMVGLTNALHVRLDILGGISSLGPKRRNEVKNPIIEAFGNGCVQIAGVEINVNQMNKGSPYERGG